MSREHIDKFYSDYVLLDKYLIEKGELSFAIDVGANFRRSLVLAIASYFEHELCSIIRQMAAQHSQANPLITSLIEKKAVSRQYHAYFDWDNLSANGFFNSFGEACKAAFVKRNKSDQDFNEQTRAFLELGQTRNRMVHLNYVQYDVEKTPLEIYEAFEKAIGFVSYVRDALCFAAAEPIVAGSNE